jgi:hypothetical protein
MVFSQHFRPDKYKRSLARTRVLNQEATGMRLFTFRQAERCPVLFLPRGKGFPNP